MSSVSKLWGENMQNKFIYNEKIICNHCHQLVYMEYIDSASKNTDENSDSYYVYLWSILKCSICGGETILYGVFDEGDVQYVTIPKILYPPEPPKYVMPNEISLVFNAAIKTMYHTPSAAVNQFRVILEMIWNDKIGGKKPRNLRGDNGGMIYQLVQEQILSGYYADMADMLAIVGNAGSHNAENDVTLDDAILAQQLCQNILKHVYELLPAGQELIAELEKKFGKSGWLKGKPDK